MKLEKPLLTIVQNFQRTFFLSGETNNLRNGFFCLRQCAESCWIWESVNLLDQFESNEVEDEGLLIEHYNHHILSQLDIHDELICVESNLCSILFLVIVPNNYFVSLLLIH
jgi:hypothetical protein